MKRTSDILIKPWKSFFGFFIGFAVILVLSGQDVKSARKENPSDRVPAVLVSYNIHIGRGMDKIYNLSRTAAVLRKSGAETIVLNEVDVKTQRSNGDDQAACLAGMLKMNFVFGRAFTRHDGVYGNAVLSRHPIKQVALIDLPANQKESRSALVVKILAPRPYYIIATHFTNRQTPEMETARNRSVDLIAQHLRREKWAPAVLCGDLNAKHNSSTVKRLQEQGFTIVNDLSGRALTFPANKPRILLDYFCLYPAGAAEIRSFRVLDETVASDHRPIRTELIFNAPGN